MSDTYVCSKLVSNVCIEWVKSDGLLDFNLTAEQASQLFVATAMLFATAWVFREIGFFIKRK